MRRPALLAPQAAASRWERAAARSRRDQSGGAVSLWVVLMVPVSAFAAVVAMAGPQRMAASPPWTRPPRTSPPWPWPGATARVLAGLAARVPPECLSEGLTLGLDREIEALKRDIDNRQAQMDAELSPTDSPQLGVSQVADRAERKMLTKRRDLKREEWLEACDLLFRSMWSDLGHLGVDMGTLRGFYSDSLSEAEEPEDPLPCSISPQVEVRDAVHVALVADWRYAGWATAQVWPDGARMGAESIGRLRRTMKATSDPCKNRLDVLDSEGRLVSLKNPDAPSRRLSQSVPGRTVVEG